MHDSRTEVCMWLPLRRALDIVVARSSLDSRRTLDNRLTSVYTKVDVAYKAVQVK